MGEANVNLGFGAHVLQAVENTQVKNEIVILYEI